MPKDIEILPPIRTEPARPVAPTVSVPTLYNGGPISSRIDEWVWNSRAKAIGALARVNENKAHLLTAQNSVVLRQRELEDSHFELEDARRKRGHELQLRTIQRATEVRAYVHNYEMHELRYAEEKKRADTRIVLATTENTQARTELRHAERKWLDADQQYTAQEKYCDTTQAIKHKQQQNEMLGLQLDEAAARRLLRKLQNEEPDQDEMLDELYARRDQFLASGRDVSRIQKEIDRYENNEATDG